jgi:hypothetical protein
MRPLATLLVLFAFVIAGCGGDESGDSGSSLDTALGYLAEDTPLVIAISTDLDGDQFEAARSIAEKFPIGGQVEDQLKGYFEDGGADFDEDIRPLLGNEFVVGAPSIEAITVQEDDRDFVAAIQAEDGDKLKEAVGKGTEEAGEQNGATLYTDSDGDAFAVEDDVLVVARSEELLKAALEQRDADDRLTEDAFDEGLADLPQDALVKVYSDVGALIESSPDAEQARKVKWVGALETLGLTASVEEDQVAVDFNLATNGEDLSEEDLPLADGAESPELAREDDEIGVGVRRIDQIFEFARNTARALDPREAGQIDVVLKQVEQRTGVALEDDVLGQLAGGVSASFDLNGQLSAVRGEPEDPEALADSLAKLAPELPDLLGASGGRVERSQGDGGTLYTVSDGSGESLSFGVIDEVFVVGETPQAAREGAARETRSVEGAQGVVVFNASGKAIADNFLSQLGGAAGLGGSLFTGPIGDLTGSVESSTDGLRGRVTLAID